jgi:galactose mutarotase-like enzyme
VLDGRGIPTGELEPFEAEPGPLGEREYDDLFTDVSGEFLLEGGGRRVAVAFEQGYPWAQVYAPAGEDFICFEPMTAPTNALVSGGPDLRQVVPGGSFSARFSIAVG